ncbi:cyclic-di-AMP receptor [Peptoniphilus sp. KCTC 25270]|uniref:cyclic-di-AMP receptor n=1 Tax=Peptoniphilus sp. KCTC 25270 TaxID=2897414 RepID=UPI001E652F49|nr:cyclic-di-AMP receptor [Peptoniphilus sp. KCTC 25270]MCD1147891.1 cyclic-di-AMP receptor [Peptoniphilus sp. KCTC 25270]
MKMVFAIVQDQDAADLVDTLTQNDFRVTKLSSSGGFLKAGNTTLFMGVEEEELPELLEILEKNCSARDMPTSLMAMSIPGDSYIPEPINVRVGGATIFVLDVETYKRY